MKTKFFSSLFLILWICSCSDKDSCLKADLIIHSTQIYTLNDSMPEAESLAIKGGNIVYVGTNDGIKAYQCNDQRSLDLTGKFVFPGFIDSHAHLKSIGYRESSLNLQGINSLKETLAKVREYSNQKDSGQWVIGRGWIEKLWPEKRFPNKHDLDSFSKDKPILLERADGHAILVNSYALKLAGIDSDTLDPPGGAIRKEENGEPTGILVDKASNLVERILPSKTRKEHKAALMSGIERSIKLGWTQIQNAGGPFSDVDLLEEINLEGNLLVRLYYSVSDGDAAIKLLEEGPKLDPDNKLIVRGIKLYADGALGSRGALLLEGYSDFDSLGLQIFSKGETMPKLITALKKGIQIQTHAIGDKANRITLDWYEEAFKSVPDSERFIKNPRWRIEHAQNIQPVDQNRFRELNIIASMQPSHAIGDLHFAVDRLGLDRINNAYVWRHLIDKGITIIGGSDAPVEIGDPLIEFYAAVSRKDVNGFYDKGWNLDQAISREEALKMFTIWPAFGAFQEEIKGSIEVGKLADITVFSKDIMKVPSEEILKAKNLMTIVGGEIVYEDL